MSAPYLTEKELAARWDCGRKKLWKLRKKGSGPNYTRFGHSIRYFVIDVLAYEKKTGMTSDGEIGVDFSDQLWLQHANLSISNALLYMILYSLVYTVESRSLGSSEYINFKQLVQLIRDRLIVNIPSARSVLIKMCDNV